MADRLTSIHLPGSGDAGVANFGRKSAAEMIAYLKTIAREQLRQAQLVIEAEPEEFHIVTYLGVHVQRKREIVQKSSRFT